MRNGSGGRALAVAILFTGLVVDGSAQDTPHAPARGRVQTTASPITLGGPELALHIVARAQTGAQPKSVNLSADGRHLYVLNFGRPDHDNVLELDAQTLARTATGSFPGNACESALSPDGHTLYVSNFRDGKLEVLDAQTLAVRGEVRVGHNPKVVAVSPDGNRVYVSNWSSASVSAVDAHSLQVVGTARTGVHPRGMTVRRDGTVMVTSTIDDTVLEFRGSDLQPGRRLTVCSFPRHIILSPDERQFFISCSGSMHVAWYDTATGARLGVAPVGMNPRTIDITSDGRYVVSADFTARAISVIDVTARQARTTRLDPSSRIVGLVLAPGNGLRVYATSWEAAELLVLEPGSASHASTSRDTHPRASASSRVTIPRPDR